MNDDFPQISQNTSALKEQKNNLKNIEFEEFDMQKLSEGSYIELTDENINKVSETIMCVKDILKISEQTKSFRATVNVELLSKFSNGTYSTIIRDSSGHIIGHAGFEQIGLLDVGPMIIFKVASFITNQYYLHNINEELRAIKKTLDYLKRDIHQKTISTLGNIKEEIDIRIKNPNTNDESFINKLEDFRLDIKNILVDYKQKLEAESKIKIEPGFFQRNTKKLKEKEKEISFYLKIIASCEFLINVINSLILYLYIKKNADISFQKELIEKSIKESTLLNDCEKYYDEIIKQYYELKSNFEEKYILPDNMDKMTKKQIANKVKKVASWRIYGNPLNIPFFVAMGMKTKRTNDTIQYQRKIELEKQKIKNFIQSNNKKIEDMVGNKELIYITDNQNKKRLFMKVSSVDLKNYDK